MSNRLTAKTFDLICNETCLTRTGWNIDESVPGSSYWVFSDYVNGQKEVTEWRDDWKCAWITVPGEPKIEVRKVYEFKVMLNQAIEKWKRAYIKEQMVELEREIEKLD